eukprot:s2112_g25.t1
MYASLPSNALLAARCQPHENMLCGDFGFDGRLGLASAKDRLQGEKIEKETLLLRLQLYSGLSLRSLGQFAAPAFAVTLSRRRRSLRCQTAARCTNQTDPSEEPREFFEVELETEEPEATMEILFGMGAISSSFCEQAEKAQRFRVIAQFDRAIDIPRCSSILMSALDLSELPTVRSKGLGQGTWIDHFPLCDGFEVRLPCHKERDSGRRMKRTVVYLEGSTAFGAGDHPTTRGAAAFLKDNVCAGDRVLDYGTGSGVLAICAAMCNAERVLGLDTDPVSIASAQRSLSLNKTFDGFDLQDTVEFLTVPEDPDDALQFMSSRALQDDYVGFDVIVANILYEPLLRLARTLAAVAVPGSKLCLTGLRSGRTEPAQIESAEHIQKLSKVYEEFGFQNFCSNELSAGWCLLTAEKRQVPKANVLVVSMLDGFEVMWLSVLS